MADPGFFPFPEITTDRLLLRRMSLSDAPRLFSLRADKTVMAYIDRELMKSQQEAETLLQQIDELYNKGEGLLWVITEQREPEKLIGTIGYWHILKAHYRAELGYILDPAYWRKGIMTEAVQAIIPYAFGPMQMHSIEARINPDNQASAALLEKNGFVREAYYKEDYFFRGQFMDTAVYSLLVPRN